MGMFLAEGASAGDGAFGLVITLVVIGLAALAVELLVIPGFGVAGLLGVVFLAGAAVSAWVLFGALWGGLIVALSMVITIAFTIFIFKSRTVKKRLILSTALEKGGGTASGDLSGLIGAVGLAQSDLRPAGIAMVDNERIDVVSEGGFVEKGTEIKVVAVDGPRVIVARLN